MIVAALVIFLLPNQGYWFGGQAQEVTVRWAARGASPATDLTWNLMLGKLRLAGDTVSIAPGDERTVFRIVPPVVRTRVSASVAYQILSHNGGKELGSGEIPVQLFPRDALAGMDQRLKGKSLVVWDSSDSLSKILRGAKVEFTATKDGSGLTMAHCDVILVGAGMLGPSPFEQQPLLDQACAGASVMVFAQKDDCESLFGYALRNRKTPKDLNWRTDDPLFAELSRPDLDSWLRDSSQVFALDLPADEPALEIVWWPRETPSAKPVPLDALVVCRSIGAGRIVLCQLPLGNWGTDPRNEMLLSNAIDFLLTRPEPTLRPSRRPTTEPAPLTDPNRIKLPGE